MSQLKCFTCSKALTTVGLPYYTLDTHVCSRCEVPLMEKILFCLPQLQDDLCNVDPSNIRICTSCSQNLCTYYSFQTKFLEAVMDGSKSKDSFSIQEEGEKNLSGVKIKGDKNHTNTEDHQDMSLPESEDMSLVVISDDRSSSREYLQMSPLVPSEDNQDDMSLPQSEDMSPVVISDDMSSSREYLQMSPLAPSEEDQDDTSLSDFEDMPRSVLSEDDEPTTCTLVERNVAATLVGENTVVFVCGVCGRLFNELCALNLHFEEHTYENMIIDDRRGK